MKKFIIFLAGLFLVSGITVFATSNSYSRELNNAYSYAHQLGITTQSTIQTADMTGNLIRSHLAKMMVMYASGVLGMEPNEYMICQFDDIANQSEELHSYIMQACQMGLMGVGITSFNPNGVVTRAEFGTVLSRAMFGDTYNGGAPYYRNHLHALKNFEVMNFIDTPTMIEQRGYVMLMMQRGDQKLVEIFDVLADSLSGVLELPE